MKKKVINTLLILIGTFILAVSVEVFIIPYHILSGGVAGIAVALEPIFHINETLFANAATVILFIIGRLILGRQFAVNTIIASLAYPVFTTLLSVYPITTAIEPILASFYAGLLGGVGIGIVMRTGASTGGMDIPPLILNKLTGLDISTLVMITDGLTVLLGIYAYGLDMALIGMVSVFATGLGVSRMLQLGSGSHAKHVQIISDSWQKIRDEILKQLDRGTTLIDATGGFSNANKKILMVVVSETQYTSLLEIVRSVDPSAFVITTDATDMHGEGFTYTAKNI